MLAKMRAASQSFKLLFIKTLITGDVAEHIKPMLDMVQQMDQTTWTQFLRWFEELPIPQEWVGDRKYLELTAQGQTLRMKPYEASIKVMREDIIYDQLGGVRKAAANMARQFLLAPWREGINMFQDAFDGTVYGNCYDGYPLFSDSHPTGDNKGTAALTASAMESAIAAMRGFVDGNSESMLVEPTHLWYHTDLEPTVDDILEMDIVLDSTSTAGVRNRNYKKLKKLPLHGLSSTEAAWWGLVDLSRAEEKPAIWVKDPRTFKFWNTADKEDEPDNRERREIKFGLDYYAGMHPGMPWTIWGSNGTT